MYGIPRGVCGVYEIKNEYTGDTYIGASVDISSRLSTHFVREVRIQTKHPMYSDIKKYGRERFSWRVIEECSQERLLEREQYHYDILNPTYNIVRPSECPFNEDVTKRHATQASQTDEHVLKRKLLYRTEEYRTLFSKNANWKKKAVNVLYEGCVIKTFESICACERWINETTSYIGKNKCSKIKAVCDGERPSAYGYQYEYAKCRDYPEME